jgi:hypothetical protein
MVTGGTLEFIIAQRESDTLASLSKNIKSRLRHFCQNCMSMGLAANRGAAAKKFITAATNVAS